MSVLRQYTHTIADIGHPLVCVIHHEGVRTLEIEIAKRMPFATGTPFAHPQAKYAGALMSQTTLTISSKNYSSWSLRGWLMAKLARIDFEEIVVAPGDADARAEILLLSPSILVPCLTYNGIRVWDTLAIGEFLNEIAPKAGLLPKDQAVRAHCRSVSGEMHSGFVALRQALPMNIKAQFPSFKIWSKARADIDRIVIIWSECLQAYGGPFLFGKISMADAMYAPVVSRFRTYGIKLDGELKTYAERIWDLPAMQEWREAALAEHEEIEELEAEF
jgi:glutathione S-transferase